MAVIPAVLQKRLVFGDEAQYRALKQLEENQALCNRCDGEGQVECSDCHGTGKMSAAEM